MARLRLAANLLAPPAARIMDPVDITWLRMDRPSNRMVVVGVLILQGPVDLARLELTLARRLLGFERFRQRVERRGGVPWWAPDPHFDLAHHLKRTRLPGRGGRAQLQQFVAELAMRPLDRAHPLWEFHIVEGYEGGAALVSRVHHAVADGIALVEVLLSLSDEQPHRRRARPRGAASAGGGHNGFVWEEFLRPAVRAVEKALQAGAASVPAAGVEAEAGGGLRYLQQAAGVVGELAYLLFMPSDTPTRFKGVPQGDKRVAWTEPIALPQVKAVGHALGCSVNDLLLAAVAGALRAYLQEKGDPTEGVEVRALVPINLREPGAVEELGNRFGIIAIELPVGIENPLERLYELRRRMEALKTSYEPAVTLGLFAALGYAPQLLQDKLFDLLLSRATAVLTNVPGPRGPIHVAGAELRQIMFWVPQSGNLGLGVSLLSFNGQVHFGLIADAAMVPDPQAIIDRFAPEFDRLVYFVLLSDWGERPAVLAPPARAA